MITGAASFLDGFRFFWNADPARGFAPSSGGVRMGADFFVFWIWGGVGLVMRMGGERRFAPLLRISAPVAISSTFGLLLAIFPHCAIRTSPYAYPISAKMLGCLFGTSKPVAL